MHVHITIYYLINELTISNKYLKIHQSSKISQSQSKQFVNQEKKQQQKNM